MTSRRSFIRTAVAALMAQWIKLPELSLVEETAEPLIGYVQYDLTLGYKITAELMVDDLYPFTSEINAEIARAHRRMAEDLYPTWNNGPSSKA